MTPQEEQLLNSLVERINQTQLQEIDVQAEALLQQTLGRNPDALYILAQTVLVQNIALEQAKAQVTQLQQAQQTQQQPAHATSFLGRLLGERDTPAPQQYQAPPQAGTPMPGYQPVNPQYTQAPQYAQAPPQYGPPYGDPQYAAGGGQPSFLRGAMQTAAGVAAGALAFEGVESILHGFGHPGMGWGGPGFGMGGGMMGGGFERPVEETVVNNYYDDPGARAEHGGFERGEERHFHETADQGGAQFNDASYNTGDDRNELDAANRDDSANWDDSGSGFDDGGSSDDGGGFDSGGDVL